MYLIYFIDVNTHIKHNSTKHPTRGPQTTSSISVSSDDTFCILGLKLMSSSACGQSIFDSDPTINLSDTCDSRGSLARWSGVLLKTLWETVNRNPRFIHLPARWTNVSSCSGGSRLEFVRKVFGPLRNPQNYFQSINAILSISSLLKTALNLLSPLTYHFSNIH